MKTAKGALNRLSVIAGVVLAGTATLNAQPPGFYVDGRFLYDKCGEKVILKGTNAMILYWDRPGTVTYPEIAKTGANVVRIFWNITPDSTTAEFNTTITNCINNKMIPMPAVWDAMGDDWPNFQACIDWWTRPEMVAVIQQHEESMIVNIANEAGNWDVNDQQFRTSYENAILQMRNAGILTPLVIDAAGWGRGESYILNNAQYLINADPEHNLIFSWHPYDPISWGGTQQRIKAVIDGAISQNICMIIGEFAECEQGGNATDCANTPIDWQYIIQYATENETGWLPWVWWCCSGTGDSHSLTYDKIYGHWSNLPWGQEVAVTSPYSIQNNAVRPYFMAHGVCGAPEFKATEPVPRNGATGLSLTAGLAWTPGYGATNHDVYFGADSTAVANATHDSNEYKGDFTDPNFDPGILDFNTTYYWAVDEVNETNVTPGDLWQFTTTEKSPPITFDATSSNSSGSSGSTLSWSHTIGHGSNRILVVGVAAEGDVPANMPVSSVTYNGNRMTLVPGSAVQAGTTTLMRTELYFLLNQNLPPPGTYSVNVTYAGSVINRSGGAVSLFNAEQSPPEAFATNSNADSNTISTAVTTLTDSAWVVDVIGCGNSGTFTATGAGMAKRWATSPSSSAAAAATKPVPSAGAATMTWQHSGANRLTHSLAAFAPAPSYYPIGDLSLDLHVNLIDLDAFAERWLDATDCAPHPDCPDLDDSGDVNFSDFALVGQNWGT